MNREVETHLETSLCNVVLRLFKLWSPGVEFGHHKGGGFHYKSLQQYFVYMNTNFSATKNTHLTIIFSKNANS